MYISARSAKTLIPLLALSFATAMAPAIADSSNGDGQKSGVIYNSVLTPLPGNLPSVGFASATLNEFGNAVNFSAGNSHSLSKVVVTMSSWGCVSGSWNEHTCDTPEDATFAQPITLNIYKPTTTNGVSPGTKIASITKTFDIKYRPSASPECTGANLGKWYDEDSKRCFNGLAQNITFNLKNVKVGSSAIFGIAYNTSDYGYAPIGAAPCRSTSVGCPYDSLNVALTQDPTDVTVGTSVVPGKLWLSSGNHWAYADGYLPYNPALASVGPDYGWVPLTNPTNAVGTFRIDSPNAGPWWGVNYPYTSAPWDVPAIKVFANQDGNGDNQTEAKSSPSHSSESSSSSSDNSSEGKHGIKKD